GANARAEGRYQNVMHEGPNIKPPAEVGREQRPNMAPGIALAQVRALSKNPYRPCTGCPLEGLLPGGRMLGMVTIIDNRPLRHPEKAAKPDAPLLRKPDWIRVRMPTASAAMSATRRSVREHGLHTVCEEPACPNIGECWRRPTPTMRLSAN